MNELARERCEACRVGAPRLTTEELAEHQKAAPNWHVVELEGIQRLQGVFTFPDFAKALRFTDQVGALAEAEGHHPSILTEWGKVTVTWWTHKIKGLHRNDFVMAAKTDQLLV